MTAIDIERLGQYITQGTVNRPVIWKGTEYVFNNYCYDGNEYVMINIKKGGSEDDFVEVGRIKCDSKILVINETQKGIELLEAVY